MYSHCQINNTPTQSVAVRRVLSLARSAKALCTLRCDFEFMKVVLTNPLGAVRHSETVLERVDSDYGVRNQSSRKCQKILLLQSQRLVDL